MIELTMNPQDVLFFRDGKPFGADASFAETIFPPYPSTFAGALRAVLLHRFSGDDKPFDPAVFFAGKNESLKKIVGEFIKPEKGGVVFKQSDSLRIKQIVLEDKKSRFYHAPADLLFSWVAECEIPFYHNGKSETFTHRLVNLSPETVKPVKDKFLNEEQLKRYLAGQVDPLEESRQNKTYDKASRFFIDEPHIKNQLESRLKVSRDEGGLYMYHMKRIKEGVFFRVVFEAAAKVDEAVAEKKDGFVTIGGESRVAHYCFGKKEDDVPYGSLQPNEFFKQYEPETDLLKVILTTPAVVYDEVPQKITDFFHVKGIAVPGEVPVGGWDLRNSFPKPMVRAYLPGTVFLVQPRNGFDEKVYCKIQDTLYSDERSEEGFGAVLVGIQKNILSKK